jgi:hypothetical protein
MQFKKSLDELLKKVLSIPGCALISVYRNFLEILDLIFISNHSPPPFSPAQPALENPISVRFDLGVSIV